MGACCSSTATYAGSTVACREVKWDGGHDTSFSRGRHVEVGGIPLDCLLAHYHNYLEPQEQQEIVKRVVAQVDQFGAFAGPVFGARDSANRSGSGSEELPDSLSALLSPETSLKNQLRISHHRSVRVGTLSWNVGGISDHRQGAGAGIEQRARQDVIKVLSAAMEKMGRADVIVVGLQEIISLTPTNAMKATRTMKSAAPTLYGHPETVVQWRDLLLSVVNKVFSHGAEQTIVGGHLSEGPQGDSCTYALYGSPVYLFGMLLCVFCRTELLRSIKDFSMAERAMDLRRTGAKGVVACRFVLFDRSFCFINCHLSATTTADEKTSLKSFEQRRKQIQRIWSEVKFVSHVDQMVYPVKAHRAVFLLGDTNMRLRRRHFGTSEARDFHQQASAKLDSAKTVGPDSYAGLWACDELRSELDRDHGGTTKSRHNMLSASLVELLPTPKGKSEPLPLSIWQEPSSSAPFPPTFKLAVPGPGYSKKRVPAWTDRVLYRSQHVRPQAYGSAQQSEVLKPPRNISDHDPVFARFDVHCVTINSRKLGLLMRDVQRAFRRSSDGSALPERSGREVLEQSLAFRACVEDAAHAGIEDFSRHVFDSLLDVGSADELQTATTQVLDCQEELWRLLGTRLELQLVEAIRESVAERRQVSVATKTALSRCEEEGMRRDESYFSSEDDSWPTAGQGAGGAPDAPRALDAGALASALRKIMDELREPVPAPASQADGRRMVQRL